jgi:hypothetical protein
MFVRYIALSIVFTTAALSGCATIMSGSEQTISFNSEPEEADVYLSGRKIGTTPLRASIPKGGNKNVSFRKDGYKTYNTALTTTFDGWFIGNLITGLFGSTTDAATGSINEFSPDQYFVTLVPIDSANIQQTETSKVRQFVLAFGPQIREDIRIGEGEKLDALLALLQIKNTELNLKDLKTMAYDKKEDIDLAETLISFYLQK